MNCVAVDIGNSALKLGLAAVTESGGLPRWEWEARLDHADAFSPSLPEACLQWLVSCVDRAAGARLAAWVEENRPQDALRILESNDIPLQVNLPDPSSIGRDRLLAALAAWRHPLRQSAVVVIDAGTAITLDWVDADGVFQGGTIFPGDETLLRALAQATDALPDLTQPEFSSELAELAVKAGKRFGKSTREAIQVGVSQMVVGAVERLLKSHRDAGDAFQIFLTGGGSERLQALLDDTVIHVPDLVLQGCWQIAVDLQRGAIE